jgi:DNA mismatch repair ATPase MutS
MPGLSTNYPAAILTFKAGAFAQTFNEDALLLHTQLKFKLVLLGADTPYLRVGFPLNPSQ